MNLLFATEEFLEWFRSPKIRPFRSAIVQRLDRLRSGNAGDCRPLRSGVSEMKINKGPGFRLYFAREGQAVYLLLLGGDKSTQNKDIEKAIAILNREKGNSHADSI